MATYNVIAEQNRGSIEEGSNWIYLELDFNKYNASIADVFRLFKLKNGWIFHNSFYKVINALTTNVDLDIGYDSGTEIVDLDAHAAGAWVQGSVLPSAVDIISSNGYITVVIATAAAAAGKIGLMLEIIVPRDLAEPVSTQPW
jgi:hypothetical protein